MWWGFRVSGAMPLTPELYEAHIATLRSNGFVSFGGRSAIDFNQYRQLCEAEGFDPEEHDCEPIPDAVEAPVTKPALVVLDRIAELEAELQEMKMGAPLKLQLTETEEYKALVDEVDALKSQRNEFLTDLWKAAGTDVQIDDENVTESATLFLDQYTTSQQLTVSQQADFDKVVADLNAKLEESGKLNADLNLKIKELQAKPPKGGK